MRISFTKMHGCGNDYIYFDCFKTQIENPEELAVKLSDRRKSIGGDGVILVCRSDKADARMRMFNLDGSEGMMCGNGIRCVGKYVYDSGIAKKPVVTIDTKSGVKVLELTIENGTATAAKVDMGAPVLKPTLIPMMAEGDTFVAQPLEIGGKTYTATCVSMGNPHCVVFCDEDVSKLELEKIGPLFEKNAVFPEGVNTEFVNVIDFTHLVMRVWERGSGETMACGTGACAVAVAAVLNGYADFDTDVTVQLSGGDLTIRYTRSTVFMTGEAVTAFVGEVEV